MDSVVGTDWFISLFSFLIFAGSVILSGSVIGAIAKRKHRNTWLWKATGAFGFFVALVAILCFRDLNSLSPEGKKRSKLKEMVIFVMVIVMFVTSLSIYLQAQ